MHHRIVRASSAASVVLLGLALALICSVEAGCAPPIRSAPAAAPASLSSERTPPAVATSYTLIVLPLRESGVVPAPVDRLVEQLRAIGTFSRGCVLDAATTRQLIERTLLPAAPPVAPADWATHQRAIQEAKEGFLLTRFDPVVFTLGKLRAALEPALDGFLREQPEARERFFHAMMLLGRALEALGRVAESNELYAGLVRSFPGGVVDARRYPPSLVQRYATFQEAALATAGRLTVHIDGLAPMRPGACRAFLDGAPRGGVGVAIRGVPAGVYRCSVHCEEGLSSRSYRVEVPPRGAAEVTAYLGEDEPVDASREAPGLALEPPWPEHDYLGGASVAGHLTGASGVVLVGPARSDAAAEVLLVDPGARRVVRRKAVREADLPRNADAARDLLSYLLPL